MSMTVTTTAAAPTGHGAPARRAAGIGGPTDPFGAVLAAADATPAARRDTRASGPAARRDDVPADQPTRHAIADRGDRPASPRGAADRNDRSTPAGRHGRPATADHRDRPTAVRHRSAEAPADEPGAPADPSAAPATGSAVAAPADRAADEVAGVPGSDGTAPTAIPTVSTTADAGPSAAGGGTRTVPVDPGLDLVTSTSPATGPVTGPVAERVAAAPGDVRAPVASDASTAARPAPADSGSSVVATVPAATTPAPGTAATADRASTTVVPDGAPDPAAGPPGSAAPDTATATTPAAGTGTARPAGVDGGTRGTGAPDPGRPSAAGGSGAVPPGGGAGAASAAAVPSSAPRAEPTPVVVAGATVVTVPGAGSARAQTGHGSEPGEQGQGGSRLQTVTAVGASGAPFVLPTPAAATAVPAAGAATANAAMPLAQQLARPVFTLAHAGPGEHVVTVQVTPDALGPVTVRAHVTAHGMHVDLFAASDAGREAVRQVLPDLRRDAAGSGLATTMDLSSQNHPEQAPGRDPRPSGGPPDTGSSSGREARPTARTPGTVHPSTVRTVGLDVLA